MYRVRPVCISFLHPVDAVVFPTQELSACLGFNEKSNSDALSEDQLLWRGTSWVLLLSWLCNTSIFAIFTFIDANDLKFCTRSFSSCVYRRFERKSLQNDDVTHLFPHMFCLVIFISLLDCFSVRNSTEASVQITPTLVDVRWSGGKPGNIPGTLRRACVRNNREGSANYWR